MGGVNMYEYGPGTSLAGVLFQGKMRKHSGHALPFGIPACSWYSARADKRGVGQRLQKQTTNDTFRQV